jgi:SAM-dependent methyltransferase
VNTYQHVHARHYDLIYAEKPYAEEAAFVARRLPPPPATLLDVACGTARHAIAFAAMGYEVTAVDYSPDLLRRARQNLDRASASVALVEADMRTLDLGRSFDAVTCLFDSIGYPQDDEGIVAALRAMRGHLAANGVLAIEHLHAEALLAAHEPVKVRRWPLSEGGRLVRVSETRLDTERRVMAVDYELIEMRSDATYDHGRETQRNRFFSVAEMQALLERSGLAPIEAVAAYRDAPQVGPQTFHVLASARAA